METTEIEKVKAAIKRLWKASKDRQKEKSGLEYAYEVGIQTGLQGLAFKMSWGEINLWD